jgi:hypothetical protein
MTYDERERERIETAWRTIRDGIDLLEALIPQSRLTPDRQVSRIQGMRSALDELVDRYHT